MKTLFTWKHGGFSNTFQLFRGGEATGYLKLNAWRSTAEGDLLGHSYTFVKPSFWTSTTDIFEKDQPQPIGTISYNLWRSRATLTLTMGERHQWQYGNFWRTKWQFLSQTGALLRYARTGGLLTTEGEISGDSEPSGLLVLAGLYIHVLFTRQAAASAGA